MIFANDNGTLRTLQGIFVNDNGVLRDIQSAFVNDDGVLREIFRKLSLSAGPGGTITGTDGFSPYESSVGIRFLNNGNIQTGFTTDGGSLIWTTVGQWIDPVSLASGNFSVRYTNRVGDSFTNGAAEDTWSDLSVDREWTWTESGIADLTIAADFQVRDDVTGAPQASTSYTFRILQQP